MIKRIATSISEIWTEFRNELQSKIDDFSDSIATFEEWWKTADLTALVGIVAVLIASGMWYFWMTTGMHLVRSNLAMQSPVSMVTAPTPTTQSPLVTVSTSTEPPLDSSSQPINVHVTITQLPPPQVEAPPKPLEELGQTGDAFGSANALFSAIAGGLLVWAGWLQRKSLLEARQVNRKQQFETTFFELLTLARELENRFRRISTTRPYIRTVGGKNREYVVQPDLRGYEALSGWARKLFEFVSQQEDLEPRAHLVALVTYFNDFVYKRDPGGFGPYFRVLFQTFKLIESSTLSYDEKVEYANIARGQISEDAVFLLACNAPGPYGKAFVPYINRYGLLEHMNREFLKKTKEAFLCKFDARAFMGSIERRNHKTARARRVIVLNEFYRPDEVKAVIGDAPLG